MSYTAGVKLQVLLLLLIVPAAVSAQASAKDQSMFSQDALSIWSSGEVTIPSPDGTKEIVIKRPDGADTEETHTVTVRAGGHVFKTKMGALVNAEMGRSKDSKAFFLTYSDGGMVGTYHVKVVYVTRSGILSIEPVPNGRRLAKPKCFDPETPNVGAIGWIGAGSNQIAIAVQVPPHSSCASMGTFKAFLIQLPSGMVMASYDQIEAKRKFSDKIGSILRYADDDCVRDPQRCIPCGMRGGKCNRP